MGRLLDAVATLEEQVDELKAVRFAILARLKVLEDLWDEHTAHAHGPDGPVIRPRSAPPTVPEPELWWSPEGRLMRAGGNDAGASALRSMGYMKHGEWMGYDGSASPVPPNTVVEFVRRDGYGHSVCLARAVVSWDIVRRYRVVGFVPPEGGFVPPEGGFVPPEEGA